MIFPTRDTMLWIEMYGQDEEASNQFLALPEEDQERLVYKAFPEYYSG